MELICTTKDNALVATLSGELDHHNAAGIRKALEDRFAAAGVAHLIFDLSKLRFMDSSGLGILIGRYKTVAALGGKTCIAAPSEQADRLLRLAGMHKIMPVFDSVDAAAAMLKGGEAFGKQD